MCFIDQSNLDYLKSGSDADVWPASRTEMGDVLLYRAAPPAPVSVPDEVCWEDVPEEITEDDMALASAWAHGFNQCRAAMLKHSEPFIVTSDHRMMEMPQVEAINAVTAMLQGVENAETPTTMQTAPALDSSPKIAELPSGNSPVIPDGWVLVPIEPTEDMIVNGFESEPDESFSDEKEWEAYDAMSGCQQAAHRAKLCWEAMISAAPKPTVR
ncbi:hypothetical protein [Enterobacter kobei]|uniref:hypothetical protein n=1 Tax=Enterobacter kobei TaxID=208224 RepID=UPI0032AEC790